MKGKSAQILFSLTVILIFAAAARAANFTAAANGDWATAATWTFTGTDADGVPDADDTVTIPNTRVVTVTGAQAAHVLNVNTGGTGTLGAGATLTLDGTAGSSYSGSGTVNGTGTFRTQSTTSFSGSANFTAPLEISGGTTTVSSSTIGGSVTILNGATVSGSNQSITFSGNLNVNAGGTLTSTSGTFNAGGANVINNGTIISPGVFNFGGGASNLSGAGVFTGNYTFLNGSPETLTGSVTIGNGAAASSVTLNTGGSLVTNGNNLTLNGVDVSGAGGVTGAGLVKFQGNSTFQSAAAFTAAVEINSGTTSASGTVGGSLVVLSGATLNTSNQSFTVSGDLTNNGTITKTSNNFNFSGANLVNNGAISGGSFNFKGAGTQNISGAGTLTDDVTIFNGSVTTLTGDVTIGNGTTATTLSVNTGGTLAVGGNILTLNRVAVSGAGTFSSAAAGKIRTQGVSSIAVGAAFTGSLEVSSGTTSASGTVSGSLTILSGATLNTSNQSFTVNGDLTNNGTITKTSGNFSFSGANLVNNGAISGGSFNFTGAGTRNLSGTGGISSDATIFSPATVLLGSNHQLATLAVNIGGTLNTAAFTLFLSGAGTPLSGAGTISNVNITYNGSAAQTVQTAANVTYNRLGVDNAAGVTLSAAIMVSQQLNLTNGALNSNSNLMLADNAAIVRDNGLLAAAPTFTGSINVVYVGATNPTTTGNEIPVTAATLKNLTINKLAGASVNLNAAATVNGALTLTNGFLVPGANVLTVANTGTASGTANSYILGSLTKQYAQIQPFTYPVGTANGYSPLNVNVTNVTVVPSNLVVGAVQAVQPNVSAAEQSAALKRYWTLTEIGSLAATLQFNYQQADVPAGYAESDLRLRRYTGAVSANIPATVNANANTITSNGPVADFSDWTAVALGPTAAEASLGGRVVNSRNQPIAGATVIVTNAEGAAVSVRTNPFGYFQFSDLKAGASYVLDARHKRYVFTPQVINLTADLAETIITAQ